MGVDDVLFPPEDAEDQWRDVFFHPAEPEVGKNRTGDREIHERRGVPALPACYAGCISGQLPDLKRRMEAQELLPELTDAD
ncbi:hypothetical protein ACGFOU_04235 [Streptomyces sp. NPDC048595]|uniref:hypothetical protein n=1 Tax=Streptomyces sp. NPDC048595 TaxID=3365576 RepID=UPI0037144F0A